MRRWLSLALLVGLVGGPSPAFALRQTIERGTETDLAAGLEEVAAYPPGVRPGPPSILTPVARELYDLLRNGLPVPTYEAQDRSRGSSSLPSPPAWEVAEGSLVRVLVGQSAYARGSYMSGRWFERAFAVAVVPKSLEAMRRLHELDGVEFVVRAPEAPETVREYAIPLRVTPWALAQGGSLGARGISRAQVSGEVEDLKSYLRAAGVDDLWYLIGRVSTRDVPMEETAAFRYRVRPPLLWERVATRGIGGRPPAQSVLSGELLARVWSAQPSEVPPAWTVHMYLVGDERLQKVLRDRVANQPVEGVQFTVERFDGGMKARTPGVVFRQYESASRVSVPLEVAVITLPRVYFQAHQEIQRLNPAALAAVAFDPALAKRWPAIQTARAELIRDRDGRWGLDIYL